MRTDTVPVELGGARYDALIRRGLLQQAGTSLRPLTPSPRVAIITDSNVAARHLEPLRESLRSAGFESLVAVIPAGESHKELSTLLPVFDTLLAAGLDRATPVITLGGGVVGDMGGFVAATLLRGLPLVHVPTTLLAMVDSSIGGKTGVNHRQGKNLIGAFHQPRAVLIDPDVLQSLPPSELHNGLAECIKHEIIRDAAGFAGLERNIDRALALDMDYLAELIAHNVTIKAKIVEADPLEKGERAHLNFGHTFGHAIERASDYNLSHGKAVALGMVAASRVAVALRMIDEQTCRRITDLIQRAGLPIAGVSNSVDDVLAAMRVDKKLADGRLRFVLPTRIGSVVLRDDVPAEVVRSAVESLRGD